ncbi:MAG: class I SAM-dependent methyltransferase [Acidobacteriota bacterium]|nr:class I SAM-dependent methyltransferase [Acidobacteriota bacterium]
MTRVLPAPEAYRRWAPSFDASASPIVALESRHLEPMLPEVRGKLLLDIGCGTGRWLTWALERRANAAGADPSAEMLRIASGKTGLGGRMVLAGGLHLPFASARADLVLCTLSLAYMAPIDSALAELARVTRPGGSVFVTDFHPDAIRAGWKRTFRSGSDVFEIAQDHYAPSDLHTAGLKLLHLSEPCFGDPERELFAGAGKLREFEAARLQPAIFIAHWKKL